MLFLSISTYLYVLYFAEQSPCCRVVLSIHGRYSLPPIWYNLYHLLNAKLCIYFTDEYLFFGPTYALSTNSRHSQNYNFSLI